MTRGLVLCVILCGACKSDAPADDTTETPSKGSAGGFSASLSADLAGSDPGSAAPSAGSGSAAPSAGSGSAEPSAGSGSATPSAGSGSATPSAGSGSAVAAKAGSAATGSAATTAGAGSAGSDPGSATTAVAPRAPVVVSAELKAIKLSMLPNWERDVDEAGTISLFVREPAQRFKFHYGYDPAGAPKDREAYKKFLADNKLFTVLADRQRGAAWYLEGTDATGKPGFRFLVNYSGKRLVCFGSLYKDSGLGDIRDEVVIQAKKICETVSL